MTRLQDLLATGIVAATIGTAGGAFIAERRLDAALADRPPLAVIDYAPFTELMAQRFAPEDLARLDGHLLAFKAEAQALVDAGYVVLNAAMLEETAESVLVLRPGMDVAAGLAPRRSPHSSAPLPKLDTDALQELLR